MHDPSNIAEQLDQLAAEFVQRHKDGMRPTVAEYAEQYPVLADEIEQLFPTLLIFEKLKPTTAELEDQPTPTHEADGFPKISAYRIIREVGRGGMGVVFEAEQLALGRRVALKVLPPGHATDLAAVQRFELEARAAAGLHHSNIVPVFDVGREGDWCYYAMQFIDGDGLDQVIDELKRVESGDTVGAVSDVTRALSGRPEDWPQKGTNSHGESAVRAESEKDTKPIAKSGSTITSINKRRQYIRKVASIGLQAAEALDHAHSRNVIHRDIKPSNLLLDENSDVWVADFGLAKLVDNDITQTGSILGTLRYMSPERFDGSCDERGDIYSLGATLYELLALEPVFSGSDHLSVMQAIKTTLAKSLDSVDPTIPIDLQTIIHKSLEKESSRRYRSARDMADDLGRFLDGRPIRARRVGLLERYWLWAKSNRRLAASLAIVALLLIAGLIGSTIAAWFFRDMAGQNQMLAEQRKEQKQIAETQRDEARLNAYYADMQLAQQDWNNGQLQRMLETLKRYVPSFPAEEVRGWEWYYLLSLAHQEERTILDHEKAVYQVEWSRDGQRFFSSSSDGTLRIWSRAGQELKRLSIPSIRNFTLSPDGKRVATIDGSPLIRYWDAESGKLIRVVRTELVGVARAEWAEQAERIVAVSPDGDELPTVFDTTTDKVIAQVGEIGQRWAKLSPDGKLLATFRNYRNRIWDVETGKLVNQLADENGKNDSQIQSFDWRSDGKQFVTGSFMTGVRLYELAPDSKYANRLGRMDTKASIESVAFSPDGKSIVAASRSQTVAIYDAKSLERTRLLKGHLGWVQSVDFHPDNQLVLSAGLDGAIKIWPVASTDAVRQKNESFQGKSPDGQWLWTYDPLDLKLNVRDAKSGKKVLSLDRIAQDRPISFVESHGRVVVRKFPNDLQIWDTSDWTEKPEAFVDTTGSVMYSYYGWNQDYLAGADGQGHLKIMNLKDLSVRRILAHDASKIGLAVSPTQNYLATIGHGEVKLWDCNTGQEIANLYGHAPDRWMSFVGFSPTGKWLATTGWDQTVILWNVADRKMARQLSGHQSIPRSVHFSRDESRLMSVAKNIKVWDVTTGREILSFPDDQPHPSPDEFSNASVRDGFTLTESTLQFDGLKKLFELKRKNSQLDKFAHSTHLSTARKVLFSANPTQLDIERSLTMAKQSVGLEPTSVAARLTLAYALYRNGNPEAAKVELEHARRSDPDNIEAQVLECLLTGADATRLQEVFARWSAIDKQLRNHATQHLWTSALRNSFPARKQPSKETITVNSLGDSIDSDKEESLTLRRAILLAHPGDTIRLQVEGVIKLEYGQLVIDKALAITGPGMDRLTIDAQQKSRVFFVNDGLARQQSNVDVSDIRLVNGRPPEDGGYNDWSHRGGAVFSLEALTLKECVLEKNHAQRGGALWVDEFSTTRLERCTFSNNTASNAGAAVCICGGRWGRRATLVAEGCTFSANKADLVGGALFSYGNLMMTNCTVHGNEAITANTSGNWVGGGIACGDVSGTARLNHCTITNNLGGGVGFYRYDSIDLKDTNVEWPLRGTVSNSIIFGNRKMGQALDIAPVRKDTGDAVGLSFSIVGTGRRFVDVESNKIGADPKLGPLVNNGGPTQTRLPQDGSPAINAASSAAMSTDQFDQRGRPFLRMQDEAADIGATEVQPDA